MKRMLLLFFAFLMFQNVIAQDDTQVPAEGEAIDLDTYFIDHKTTMGERIIMISKKYMVDPQDIYEFNIIDSDKNGIIPGTIVKVPLHKSHKKDLEKFKELLIKQNGGNPIKVPAVPPIKKEEEEEEEE
ncbi:hypothetical protein D3C87_244020 [compost metagenome]